MILTILFQILLVLLAISIFSFLYFLVVYVANIYAPEEKKTEISPVFELSHAEKLKSDTQHTFRAIIRCNCIPPTVPQRFKTIGYSDCRTLNMVFDGNGMCEKGCLGLGSCIHICPKNCIILRKGTISISDSCDGCGICLSFCPKKLIELIPVQAESKISCAGLGALDASSFCHTAKESYTFDFSKFTKNGL